MTPDERSDPGLAPSHVVGGYDEFPVSPALRPYVQVLWRHRAPVGETAAPHRVVPEPDVSLCYRALDHGAGRVEPLGVWLVGPVRTPRVYAPEPGERMYAVRLKPEWCRSVLGTHPSDHEDAVDDFLEIAPALAEPLLDRVLDRTLGAEGGADPDLNILRTLESAVGEWAEAAAPSASVEAAHKGLELLRTAGPGSSIQAAWAEWEGSSRHLRRAVRSATGASPKRLLREKRLAAALYLADRTPSPAWSRIAVATGFYDQSHLIRECQELAGASPLELHRERRSQPALPGPVSEISNTRR